MSAAVSSSRTRADRCPGALRPWPADDGLLVRLRLVGGRLPAASLRALLDVAETYGDGRVRLTGRANLQLRALPGADGVPAAEVLAPEVLDAIARTGLLPTRTHELVRNVMVSPQTGLAGGRADLRPVAGELDRLLCADPGLAALPGRFLFVLDDGRGDLLDRSCDLGLVVLDADTVQLRVGEAWGEVVPVGEAGARLAGLAASFVTRRGSGPSAPWHVEELAAASGPLAQVHPADPRMPDPAPPLPFGDVPGGRHLAVPDGIDRAFLDGLGDDVPELVVTPWHGMLVAEGAR